MLVGAQSRPEGAEHIHHWHAQVLAAAGDRAGAAAAWQRAAAEIATKTDRLRDPALRSAYLASRTARAVRDALGQ